MAPEVSFCDLSLIGVIGGTGQFGRAICKRLVMSGYHVIIGSRKPDSRDLSKRDKAFMDVRVCSIEECITSVKTIVLCIKKKHFNTLLSYQTLLSGKVIIDATNQDRRDKNESNTDYLRTMFPEALFCKAFNTISAYNMSSNDYCQESLKIPVACDNAVVRHAVCELIMYMGFRPIDYGRLFHAKQLEKQPMRILSGWGGSFLFSLGIFGVWFLHGMVLYIIRPGESTVRKHDKNFVKVCSKAAAMTSVSLLSVTYLAGCFASFTQLSNGTRRKTFARWLDKWMRARKSLGLLSMYFAMFHALATFVIMDPNNYALWYEFAKENNIYKMIWQADTALFFGIVCLIMLASVAISAIPSVADAVNWREWRFLQIWLGFGSLSVAVIHIVFSGAAFWVSMSVGEVFMAVQFHSIILPVVTLVLKLILVCPCVSGPLNKIREGIDRENVAEVPTETSDGSAAKRSASSQSRRRSDVREKSSYLEISVTDETNRPVKERTREKPRESRPRTREGSATRDRSRDDRERRERGNETDREKRSEKSDTEREKRSSDRSSRSKQRSTHDREGKRSTRS